MAEFINVTTLNQLAKSTLEQNELLNDLIVCGEISNFTRHYKSGHLYFTLKDESAAVKSVMFRNSARLLSFAPQNGMLVLAYGRATLYEKDGSFQLYVDFMRPFGAGAAQMAFDALYKKLDAEGLFAAEHKRPLPMFPKCIGLVTSKTGAALQDILNVMNRRWPLVRLLLAPVSVQGLQAEQSIVAGIRVLSRDPRPELILVTRGGGSKEDLWVFNSERIARAAYASRKPVVSAVGHEIDHTILDYVADLRAPTPSAAAELCVPDGMQIRQNLLILEQNIQNTMQNRLEMCYNSLNRISTVELQENQHRFAAERQQKLQNLTQFVSSEMHRKTQCREDAFRHAAALAGSLNPYAVLARGYTMVTDAAGKPKELSELKAGQKISLRDRERQAKCTVQEINLLGVAHENT